MNSYSSMANCLSVWHFAYSLCIWCCVMYFPSCAETYSNPSFSLRFLAAHALVVRDCDQFVLILESGSWVRINLRKAFLRGLYEIHLFVGRMLDMLHPIAVSCFETDSLSGLVVFQTHIVWALPIPGYWGQISRYVLYGSPALLLFVFKSWNSVAHSTPRSLFSFIPSPLQYTPLLIYCPQFHGSILLRLPTTFAPSFHWRYNFASLGSMHCVLFMSCNPPPLSSYFLRACF